MNPVPGTDQPSQRTVWSKRTNRRTFLKGAGIAGAASLAAPLLARTSARASTAIILGCNSGIYNNNPGSDFSSLVPGAPGVRGYRDNVIIDPTMVPTTFADIAGTKPLMSIRPHPDYFLSTGSHYNDLFNGSAVGPQIVAAISAMIQNGCTTYGVPGLAPQLTTWHEAGNLYRSGTDSNGDYWGTYLTATKVRQVHVKMQNLVNTVNASNPNAGVGYGTITYFTQGSGSRDLTHMTDWLPTSAYPMDWYGADTYWNTDNDLSTYDKIDAYLGSFRKVVQGLSGLTNPKINVPECNTHDESNRPNFFKNLANWLSQHGGKRQLTFFKCGGDSGGCWDSTDKATIDALNYIVANY